MYTSDFYMSSVVSGFFERQVVMEAIIGRGAQHKDKRDGWNYIMPSQQQCVTSDLEGFMEEVIVVLAKAGADSASRVDFGEQCAILYHVPVVGYSTRLED